MPWHIRMLIQIFLFSLVVYAYIGWRLSHAIYSLFPIPPWSARLLTFLAVLFLNSLPIVVLWHYWTGQENTLFLFENQLHWLDYLLNFPYWWGLIIAVEILPYFLLLDTIGIHVHIIAPNFQSYWTKWQAFIKTSMVLFFMCYVGIRLYWDTYHVQITPYKVAIKNLPNALQNLNLVLVGDIQLDRYTQDDKIFQFKNQLQIAKANLLLFAGDLVTNGKNFIPDGIKLLCGTQASLERIACMGDHDYWADREKIPQGLQNCGWTFLQNRHHVIPYKGYRILITGVTHIYSQRISKYQLSQLLATAPKADLKVLLVHQPADIVVETAAQYGYHLMLAGHTHGGQFIFKPFGISLTPSRLENKFYAGHNEFHGLQVVITNGLGLTLAPLRYHASAEITRIVLVSKSMN